MRRTLATGLLAGGLLLALPGSAFAHASFDVRQVPADSTQDVVLRVPLERDAANALVEVLVPAAFTVVACPGAVGWSCEQTTTSTGDTVVTLARGPGGAGDAEQFALAVTAPTEEGVYAFPTIQTYDDEVEAPWIGDPGSDQPAPRIQVGDETAPVESNGASTPHTPLASEEPAVSPSAAPGPTAGEAAAPDPGPSRSATDEATPGPVTEEDVGAGQETPAGDGPPVALVVVGALLAVGAVGGAIARYLSVRAGRSGRP